MIDLTRITDFSWLIPRHGNMRVNGIVYASKKMLADIRNDESLQQVANVACLPGIVGASLAMPDIHWGYGAPIGSVAAFDVKDGIIAPGVIGYDVNCLPGNSMILHEHGYVRPIRDFIKMWNSESIRCVDCRENAIENTAIKSYMKFKAKKNVFKLKTVTGRSIVATEDHPILTPKGMKVFASLRRGDKVAVVPFLGVPFRNERAKTIVSIEDIRRVLKRLKNKRSDWSERLILHKLRERNLLPLKNNDPRLPYLIKMMGMLFGDGTMNFIGKRGDGIIAFYADRHDLAGIKRDLDIVGYSSSRIYSRVTKLEYKGEVRIYKNYFLMVNASSLVVLLAALGVPIGNKVEQEYDVPSWIIQSPLWKKRLFLGALFAAELTKPRPRLSKKGSYYAPVLSMNKREEIADNGKLFLSTISKMVNEFEVETTDMIIRRRYVTKTKKVSRYFELVFSSTPKSLINLWGKIGFVYNRKKTHLAALAIQYLLLKQRVIGIRRNSVRGILALKRKGMIYSEH